MILCVHSLTQTAWGDWKALRLLQTNLTVTLLSSTSAQLTWTPIVYTGDTGGYEIWRGHPEGPWILDAQQRTRPLILHSKLPDTRTLCFRLH
jgi:hypothetical protein